MAKSPEVPTPHQIDDGEQPQPLLVWYVPDDRGWLWRVFQGGQSVASGHAGRLKEAMEQSARTITHLTRNMDEW